MPQHIEEIIGHENILQNLRVAFNSGKIHHAWLLCGNRGIGKASVAYLMAKYLLSPSQNPAKFNFDEATNKRVINKAHPDLFVLQGHEDDDELEEVGIKIDETRELLNFLNYAPVLSKKKVVIIDSIDSMNQNSANAILKALEEPHPNTHFFIVCHALGKVLATIRSRCRILKFNNLGLSEYRQILSGMKTKVDDVENFYRLTNGSLFYTKVLAKKDIQELIASASEAIKRKSLPNFIKVCSHVNSSLAWEALFIACYNIVAGRLKAGHDIKRDMEIIDYLNSLDRNLNIFNLNESYAALTVLEKF